MFFAYRPLHPRFGVEVIGTDLTEALADAAFAEICEAFETHSLLAFRGVDDDELPAFNGRFGTVQKSFSGNQAPFSRARATSTWRRTS